MQILCNLISIILTKKSHNIESSKILTKADSEFCYQSKQKEKTIVLPNAPQQINYRESFILYTKENAN